MKSKLFLSVYFLTGIISANETPIFSKEGVPGLAPSYVARTEYRKAMAAAQEALEMGQAEQTEAKAARAGADTSKVEAFRKKEVLVKVLKNGAKGLGLLGISALAYVGYKYSAAEQTEVQAAQEQAEVQAVKTETEVANKSYYTQAKEAVVSGYDKALTGCINAYDVAKKYTIEKPYHVATGAVAAVALAYGAYSLYYGEVATN
jgi:hypothetical protein